MRQAVLDEMQRPFRLEFLNWVDEIIVFHALSEDHLKQIVEIQRGYLLMPWPLPPIVASVDVYWVSSWYHLRPEKIS
jgi:hypothetical protein